MTVLTNGVTRRDAECVGRPSPMLKDRGNPNLVCSNMESVGSNPGVVKGMTLKLILVGPSQVLDIIRIRQGLVSSMSG